MNGSQSTTSAEEEKTLFGRVTPPSTRYATQWALKINPGEMQERFKK